MLNRQKIRNAKHDLRHKGYHIKPPLCQLNLLEEYFKHCPKKI